MDSFVELFDLIGVLARRRYQTGERCFASLGLNHSEARILGVLSKQKGAAAQETISNMLYIDRSNAGRALKSLEHAGYIRRRKDAADKRANFVEITAKGRKAVARISKMRKEMARGFFGDLKEKDATMIAERLNKALEREALRPSENAPFAGKSKRA